MTQPEPVGGSTTSRAVKPPGAFAHHGMKLYSVAEVAEILDCSGMHVYKLISLGEFDTVNIAAPDATGVRASKARIKHSDLAAYIERKTAPRRAAGGE